MRAFREFQAELEKLHQQSERTRRADKAAAIARIGSLVADHGIRPEELAPMWDRTRPTPPATAKYRDPASGATWTGRGRAPKWLAGEDRSRFEIE